MPSSSLEGKDSVLRWLSALDPKPTHILDVGVGSGTYGNMIRRNITTPSPFIMGVEAFEPYVETFSLHSFYDKLWIGDIREFPWDDHPYIWDVIIFGDVLEHMPEEDAVKVWDRALMHTKTALISLPIVPYPQGAVNGNEFERHHATYSPKTALKAFKSTRFIHVGRQIGVLVRD